MDVLSSGDLKGIISLNGQTGGDVRIDASRTFQTTSLDLNLLRWSDSIQSLELTFTGDAGTVVKIDTIQILR